MTFFQKNAQRVPQFALPRRNGSLTHRQVVLHTYEAPHTRSLLAAATYLLTRTSYGSYHTLCGAASARDVMRLAPWHAETWHSTPNNNWSIGISAVAYASGWNSIPRSARDNLVKSMAYAAHLASRWFVAQGVGPIPARRINRAQAMNKENGFISHGEMDPGRRTDPGRDFPWDDFFAEFRRLEGTTPTPTPTPVLGGLFMSLSPERQRDLASKIDTIHGVARRASTILPGLSGVGHQGDRWPALWTAIGAGRRASRLLPGLAGVSHHGADWSKVAALLDMEPGSVELDVKALAAELATQLNEREVEEFAKAIVDEKARRLANDAE